MPRIAKSLMGVSGRCARCRRKVTPRASVYRRDLGGQVCRDCARIPASGKAATQ